MLTHSRQTEEEFKDTDIIEIVERSVSLALHGIKQSLDIVPSIDFKFPNKLRALIIPGDFSRVISNIAGNAMYAMNQKYKKLLNSGPTAYTPILTVSLEHNSSHFSIKLQDNGPGVPESISNQIFTPFFTTKPTNEGTGLGLYLSLEIVNRHGGKIDLLSSNEGAVFEITIPLNVNFGKMSGTAQKVGA